MALLARPHGAVPAGAISLLWHGFLPMTGSMTVSCIEDGFVTDGSGLAGWVIPAAAHRTEVQIARGLPATVQCAVHVCGMSTLGYTHVCTYTHTHTHSHTRLRGLRGMTTRAPARAWCDTAVSHAAVSATCQQCDQTLTWSWPLHSFTYRHQWPIPCVHEISNAAPLRQRTSHRRPHHISLVLASILTTGPPQAVPFLVVGSTAPSGPRLMRLRSASQPSHEPNCPSCKRHACCIILHRHCRCASSWDLRCQMANLPV
jgi:hypothetical protein